MDGSPVSSDKNRSIHDESITKEKLQWKIERVKWTESMKTKQTSSPLCFNVMSKWLIFPSNFPVGSVKILYASFCSIILAHTLCSIVIHVA